VAAFSVRGLSENQALAAILGHLENVMANTRYQLEGNAPQLYERETVHTLGRPLAELMFVHVTLQTGDRVLDAACGTGIVTRVATQRCRHLAHIVGLDLNPGMLDVAQAHTPTTGVPVEWRQGDLRALPFPEGRFDMVLCQQGLQFVPDPGTALREMHRVLVPGGRLAFTVFSAVPVYYAILADALARHVSVAAATSCLSRYTLQDATTFRMLVEAAGFSAITFRVLEVPRRMPASAAAIVETMARAPYARDVAAVEEHVRHTIGQEVSAALQAYREGDEAVIPHRSHLVQAQRA
jgi:ubiquinone/menaquinone biosynthesis C-methylase UbiE